MNLRRNFMVWLVTGCFFVSVGACSARQDSQQQELAEQQLQQPQPQQQDSQQDSQQGSQSQAPQEQDPQQQEPQQQDLQQQDLLQQKSLPQDVQQKQMEEFPLSNGVSVELPKEWKKTDAATPPPPAVLASYAPPFHLSGILALVNSDEGSILQFATSDNPLLGHDPYWLDTQMHSPSGSGMSLPDFLFYFFFPPSMTCMNEMLHKTVNASRVPPTSEASPSALQVSYTCPVAATLPDFYASQVSSGITFRQGTSGKPQAFGEFGNLYITPMDEEDFDGMTFFVFEAQQADRVNSDTTAQFNLPDTTQGERVDFFWAIGAPSPFPFVADSSPTPPDAKSTELIHVAYAATGVGINKRNEFIDLLHHVHLHEN